jgi:type IV pilus assembly protein PilM
MQPVFSCPFLAVAHCGAERSSWAVFRLRHGKLACLGSGIELGSSGEWLKTTTAALRAAALVAPASTPMVLVLSAPLVLLKHLKTPRVETAQRAKILRFEVEQNIPFPVSDVIWDFVVSGGNEAQENLLLAVAKREVIASLCAAAQGERFKVRMILSAGLALRAAGERLRASSEERQLLLGVSGAAATLLQVDGLRFAARSWLLANGADSASSSARQLVQEARRALAYFQKEAELQAPTRVLLAGSAAQDAGLAEQLRASLQLPVQTLEISPALEPAANGAGWPEADLVGAAVLYLEPDQATVNLLPPALRRRAHLRQRRPWLVATGFLIIAALVPPWIHYHRLNATLRTELPAMEKLLAPLRAREASNRAGLEKLAALKKQMVQLQSVQDRRDAWLRLFADLQERLVTVEDVWLEKLQTVPAANSAPLKLVVSGRMLDKANPLAKVSPDNFTRLKVLIADIVDSPFVASVESERFDNSQAGILRFDFVLVTDPAHPL